jgi:acyl-CoA hydrolase
LDLLDSIAAHGGARPLVVGCVHAQLPFMANDAEVSAEFFDVLLPAACHDHQLFALPREPVTPAEHALGMLASSLVRDGGTLQIGIGALADALVHACLKRQRENPAYQQLLARLAPQSTDLIARIGGTEPFQRGLYGASEMVMDGFMHLVDAGIVRRRVYDHLGLQCALNAGRIGHVLADGAISAMRDGGYLPARLSDSELESLCHFGVFPPEMTANGRNLVLPDQRVIDNDLDLPSTRRVLDLLVAGRALRGGHILAGAFFLGSKRLYQWLRELPENLREQINMTRVSAINQLYGGREALDAAQRHDGRFFNTTMMVTLGGAAVSDGLENAQVVSGVGGQYNFVAMAHAIAGGRSILLLRSVRNAAQGVVSNIVWNYGHVTIPRHLRDLVVTEYGIADLRGRNDEDVIIALIEVADGRFQSELMQTAVAAGKLRADYQLPEHARHNSPEHLARLLKQSGLEFSVFPFGSDFDSEELKLIGALKKLKADTGSLTGKLGTLAGAFLGAAPSSEHAPLLARLGLDTPKDGKERLLAKMVSRVL